MGMTSPLSTRWTHSDAPELWNILDEATRVAERNLVDKDPKEWWTIMGHTAQVPLQVTSLRAQLTRHTALHNGTICEVGFNAGHSAVVWLEATRAKLVEFDLLNLDYSRASRRFVESRYPGRITFHQGPSRLTLPLYAERVANGTAPACDLWLLDGDHGKNVQHDFMNAIAASRPGTIVIADDAGLAFPYVRRFCRTYVASGGIRERTCTSTRVHRSGAEKTWCIGRVTHWAANNVAQLQLRIKQGVAMSREERNAAYFRARRQKIASSNTTLLRAPLDPRQMPSATSQHSRGYLSPLARARRAARAAQRAGTAEGK
jgi:predicted O-methyltransferase YrrM